MIDPEKFKAARKAAKLSQTKLANMVNVSQQSIAEIEVGRAKTTKAIYRIAEALKVKASDLDDEIPAPGAAWDETISEIQMLDPEDQQYALKSLREFVALAKKRSKRFEDI